MSERISASLARRLAIAQQGLHQMAPFGKRKRGVHAAIAHLGYVQIDTISVTERAHHHILWSRVPDYTQRHLLELQLHDRKIFEFWAHAAAYLPIEDYRYCIPTMEYFRSHHDPWPKSDRKTMQMVLDRIRNEGPLKSRDFQTSKNQGGTGWWDWKPAKMALQRLFLSGELMVSHREGFQRVYELPERILPPDVVTTPPTRDEYARFLITNAVRAHGLIRPQEASYLRKGMGAVVRQEIQQMQEEGLLLPVGIEGVAGTYYTTGEILEKPVRIAKRIRLLSPFDNAVIQRERLNALFQFDYQIEVYVPAPKRRYGYYCLPILYGDQFIGRADVKAERKAGILHVMHLHMETESRTRVPASELASALRDFAAFNGCDRLNIRKATPNSWKTALSAVEPS